MPSAEVILSGLAAEADRWQSLAVVWHLFAAALLGGLIFGWRPAARAAGLLVVLPVISVSAVAAVSGNPVNAVSFGVLSAALLGIVPRLPATPVRLARRTTLAGAMLVAFASVYPHFLTTDRWTTYLYAAPLGIVPCPTLTFAIGSTLVFGLSRSKAWAVVLGAAALLYGAIGAFRLGVALDYVLMAGVIALAAAAGASSIGRSVRASSDERRRTLPGDELIPQPRARLTHAITIGRSRADIWPWIAQMGAGSRAGWYSYDFIDNGGRRSADLIVSALQQLERGMVFPALPGATDGFTLLAFERERFLILGWLSPDHSLLMTWAFVLEELSGGATRLIVRASGGEGYQFHGLPWWLTRRVMPAVHFVMQRKQLLGIAGRAETVNVQRTVGEQRPMAAGKAVA